DVGVRRRSRGVGGTDRIGLVQTEIRGASLSPNPLAPDGRVRRPVRDAGQGDYALLRGQRHPVRGAVECPGIVEEDRADVIGVAGVLAMASCSRYGRTRAFMPNVVGAGFADAFTAVGGNVPLAAS